MPGRRRLISTALVVVLSACGSSVATSDESSVLPTDETFVAGTNVGEFTAEQRAKAEYVALHDLAVTSLAAGHALVVDAVSISGATGYVQVHLRLVDGRTTLSGAWPHAVIENAASCETCTIAGNLRWHLTTERASYSVDGLLANVDAAQWIVREVYPDPAANTPVPSISHP